MKAQEIRKELARRGESIGIEGCKFCNATHLELSPTARAVVAKIVGIGGDPIVVGGAVRDSMLGLKSKDVDIEVHGGVNADKLERTLGQDYKVDAVGKSFGVLKVTAKNGEDFDVSLPRSESKSGTGHKGFDVTVDPNLTVEQAFGRRDFTINAIGVNAKGEVIDPFGGAKDLADRVLRHTSNAFGEDPLRVLRGVQFAGRFNMTMHPSTADLARSLKSEFGTLAKERVWGEMEKLASKSLAPSKGLDVLRQTGWDEFFPTLAKGDGVAADRAVRSGLKGNERTALVLASMLHHQDADAAMKEIGATNEVRNLVKGFRVAAPHEPSAAGVRALARSLERHGLSIEKWAEYRDATQHDGGVWKRAAAQAGVLRAPTSRLISGDTLTSHGLRPGPLFGKIIAHATSAQDAGAYDSHEGALAWLKAHEYI